MADNSDIQSNHPSIQSSALTVQYPHQYCNCQPPRPAYITYVTMGRHKLVFKGGAYLYRIICSSQKQLADRAEAVKIGTTEYQGVYICDVNGKESIMKREQ